ncbi:hypothetical protein [Deinococcus sp. QL22]|uniref:hypothetical protein n=1 Tax=Deinococcus sp. QL22 TaxID=2939437 RepID=UPI0020175797|nr:hypothetical protein [Deinococcus sp. QL22]UQN05507.1 hypothetical protein M1R55_11535 [Deinococcus sp. QL22]
MTYDNTHLVSDYIRYVKAVQRHLRYEAHALRFAQALEIRVKIGLSNRCHTEHPDGPVMTVQPWHWGNSDIVRHETAHVLLWWSGLEAEIIEEYGEELGWKVVENLCNFTISFLKITQPMLDSAVLRYGQDAKVVRHLQKIARATPQQALLRTVYDDPNGLCAGFMTSGKYIQEVAQCNWSLPFGWLDRVPEPALWFPDEAKVSFARINSNATLGMCWG